MRCWRRPKSCRNGQRRPSGDTPAREHEVWENQHVARHRRRNDRRRGPHLQGRRAGRRRDHQGDRRRVERRQHARRQGLLRHARRHRPAHPSRHALHGHEFRRQLRERHQGGAVGRHDDGRRLLHPQPQPAADGGVRRLAEALEGRRLRLCLPHVHHLLGRFRARGHGQGGQGRRHDLQAFHGLQGRADGRRRADVRLVHALRRTWRDAARPRRERRNRRRAAEALHGQGRNRTRGPRAVASARCRGRSGQSRDHARRSGGRAALHRSRLLHPGARGDPPRPRSWASASMASL